MGSLEERLPFDKPVESLQHRPHPDQQAKEDLGMVTSAVCCFGLCCLCCLSFLSAALKTCICTESDSRACRSAAVLHTHVRMTQAAGEEDAPKLIRIGGSVDCVCCFDQCRLYCLMLCCLQCTNAQVLSKEHDMQALIA